MSGGVAIAERKTGRPSRHPVILRYHESEEINVQLREAADRLGLSFAEVQRIVNRAGLQALNLMPTR